MPRSFAQTELYSNKETARGLSQAAAAQGTTKKGPLVAETPAVNKGSGQRATGRGGHFYQGKALAEQSVNQ